MVIAMSYLKKALLVSAYVVSLSGCGLLIQYSGRNKSFSYDPAAIVLLIELTKLCISFTFLSLEVKNDRAGYPKTTFAKTLPFAIPAVLYAVINNLFFILMLHMPAALAMANSRVVIVAIIYYFGLKREITRDQWMAVVLLVIAVTLAQLKDDFQLHVSLYWLMAGVFLNVLSCAAGIYTELVLKKIPASLHFQNIQLYLYGLAVNFVIHSYRSLDGGHSFNVFNGFTPITAFIVLFESSNGILCGAVIKKFDNIVKSYCSACAIIVSAVIGGLWLNNFAIGINFTIGFCVLVYSIRLYQSSPSSPKLEKPGDNYPDVKVTSGRRVI